METESRVLDVEVNYCIMTASLFGREQRKIKLESK